ncbi:adenylyl-sulfate kinase [Lentzea sp. E54]|uniref:adenylyl-sulfate kinase n=1 Tax=Lentzea xerophila TaxID=3435883 RepID=UPI003DA5B834
MKGTTVWITGLPASGKSSVAGALAGALAVHGRQAVLLDGDELRRGLNADLGFGKADRAENVRRVGEVAKLFALAGVVAIVAAISPYRGGRDGVRSAHAAAGVGFLEVFMDTPARLCEERDPKGLYARARAGELPGFTGIDDPYERPANPDLVLTPEMGDSAELARLISVLLDRAEAACV